MDGEKTREAVQAAVVFLHAFACLGPLAFKKKNKNKKSSKSLELYMHLSAGKCGGLTSRWPLEKYTRLNDVVFKDKFHIYGLTTKSVKTAAGFN